MGDGGGWAAMRERRMAEPGAYEAYEAARLAFDLGKAVRELRERRNWSQAQLAKVSGMTQSAVARFEAGGTVPVRLFGSCSAEWRGQWITANVVARFAWCNGRAPPRWRGAAPAAR